MLSAMERGKPVYVNVHGRKGGRGVRPFLLLPKLVSLAVFVGAYVSAAALWGSFRMDGDSGTGWQVQAVSLVFRRVVVPSLMATLLFGLLLFLQHPRVFCGRRWLQVKLVVVALLPVLHVVARSAFVQVKATVVAPTAAGDALDASAAVARFSIMLVVGLGAALAAVFLGRHKPRLGQ